MCMRHCQQQQRASKVNTADGGKPSLHPYSPLKYPPDSLNAHRSICYTFHLCKRECRVPPCKAMSSMYEELGDGAFMSRIHPKHFPRQQLTHNIPALFHKLYSDTLHGGSYQVSRRTGSRLETTGSRVAPTP